VASNPVTGGGQFDFSRTGIFVYIAGKNATQAWGLAWLDSSGKMQPLGIAPEALSQPRLSPDGKKLAFVGTSSDLYVHDLERDATTRLSFTGKANVAVWAPDGKHIIFASEDGLSWVRSDGAMAAHQVLSSQALARPWSFSPDGRWLAYFEITPETGFDIWTLPLDLTDPDHPKPGKPQEFLRTRADEMLPRFSPDGRWIAYRSNEAGTSEIYVRPFPAVNGGKWQISTAGGHYPLWSNNRHELFYESVDNRIMVVDYTVEGDSFLPGKPRPWFDKQLFFTGTSNLDLAPDGKRFVVLSPPETTGEEKGSVHVTMLLNFFDELKRKIP
jgi:serine/threonine-protein kinase